MKLFWQKFLFFCCGYGWNTATVIASNPFFYRLDDSEMDIVHIFPTQGSLVWKFESMQKLMEVLPQLKAANIDGKNWFLRILPEIKVG